MAILIGIETNEVINGTESADTIWANGGSDLVRGNSGNDIIWGGSTDNAADTLYGDAGDDIVGGDGGNDLVYGGEGADSLYGWTGADTLYGEAGRDLLLGDQDNDLVYGGADNDSIFGHTGSDTLYGDDGNDFIMGDDSDREGTPAVNNNVTVKAYAPTAIDVYQEVAITSSVAGNSVTIGTGINGGTISNEIDFLAKNTGESFGSEKLVVDFGASNVTSANVNLKYFYLDGGELGRQEVGVWKALDGSGNVVGSGSFASTTPWDGFNPGLFNLNISTGTPFKTLEFIALDNGWRGSVLGNNFYDTGDYAVTDLTFTTQAVSNFNSNDVLFGGFGNDELFGMEGDDTLNGGDGNDILVGGNGADLFMYQNFGDHDVITDFEKGVDKIKLFDLGNSVSGLITNVGGDSVLTFDVNSTLTIKGVIVTASDFLFA